MLPGEIAPAVLLPCYATLNTLVAGFLITQNTIPSALGVLCSLHTRLTNGLRVLSCTSRARPGLRAPARRFSSGAVIWRWLYTISYEQWLWSALMINQFDGQEYSAYCHGAGSTLEAVAGLLPGPALAPPAQLGQLAGATNAPPPTCYTCLTAPSLAPRAASCAGKHELHAAPRH
jgi:hypothetical protein